MAERTIQRSETRSILGYDQRFDTQAYQTLQAQEILLSSQELRRRKNQLDLRTDHNLETALGERFNVAISQIEYQILDDQLLSPEHDEPFLEVIKRGQRYRQQYHSNDVQRELAEVAGFAEVEHILTSPNFGDAKIIVISPRGKPGSIYQHNFFDVYEKNGATVNMTRYTSAATYEQFRQAAENLDTFNGLPQNPQDADFLQTPLLTYLNSDEILLLLHPDIKTMTKQELQKLQEALTPIKLAYIKMLSQLPHDKESLAKTLNTFLNFADRIALRGSDPQTDYLIKPFEISKVINYYGALPVRSVSTGCGIQSGFAIVSSFSPFSVAEFAKGGCPECGGQTNHFHCPGCNYQIESGRGITTCPRCGLTKEQAGSKCA